MKGNHTMKKKITCTNQAKNPIVEQYGFEMKKDAQSNETSIHPK